MIRGDFSGKSPAIQIGQASLPRLDQTEWGKDIALVDGMRVRGMRAACVRTCVCVLSDSVGDLDESQAGAMINS